MPKNYLRFSDQGFTKTFPNGWDVLALIIVLGIIGLFVWGGQQMTLPYQLGQSLLPSLDPWPLPKYAALTALRMLVAMVFSLLFTFTVATWAAKSKRASAIIIPCIDILQSVPVLGFLSLTIATFTALFPANRLGPECTAIFAIFTAQVWNMSLSFYQSLRSIPLDLKEAAATFHLSAWQRFWRLEAPFAVPGLVANMMLSMSGSWVFLVAAESISVANQTIMLPGIGSYLNLAINQTDIMGVIYAMITMLIVILLYDQLLFRPLLDWSQKFTLDYLAPEKTAHSWITLLLQRTAIFKYIRAFLENCSDYFISLAVYKRGSSKIYRKPYFGYQAVFDVIWYITLFTIGVASIWIITYFIFSAIPLLEWQHVAYLGGITALRVLMVILIGSCIWLPIGVWMGLKRSWVNTVQTVAQYLAAFPANILFPLVLMLLLKYKLDVEVGTLSLMLLGSQWYILFNVIVGVATIPEDLRQVANNFAIKGWLWWKRLVLPSIFPYYMTGIVTAIGSAWNISVLAEVIHWGSITLKSPGLGAYISHHTEQGNFLHVALGIVIMSLWVLLMNYLIWQPLYRLAQRRYRLE